MKASLLKIIFILSVLLAGSTGVANAEVQACKVGDLTQGNWEAIGSFNPVKQDPRGTFPYWFNPYQIGMYNAGQTVSYGMTLQGYGTQYKGIYALQQTYSNPSSYVNFSFITGNTWGWAYHDASLVNDPRTFFSDPVVGLFTVRAFGGTQQRGATYFKYYSAYSTLTVWKWKCNPQPQQSYVKQSNLGTACSQGTCCN